MKNKVFKIAEQTIDDIEFKIKISSFGSGEKEWKMTITGDCLKFGNRDLYFSTETGENTGGGTEMRPPVTISSDGAVAVE